MHRSKVAGPVAARTAVEAFSQRERDVIAQLAKGQSVRQVAAALGLTVNTVKDYIKTIYSKAQVHSARELLVQLYGHPDLPPHQRRQAALLQSFERVMAAGHVDRMMAELAVAVRLSAAAARAGIWKRMRLHGKFVLVPLAGGSVHYLESCGIADTLGRGGWAVLDGQGARERRELAGLGLEPPVLGLTLDMAGGAGLGAGEGAAGPVILLAAKAEGQGFSDMEILACRVLARLAETRCAELEQAASAGLA